MPELVGLDLAGDVAAWAALGFTAGDRSVRVGRVRMRLDGDGGGIRGWTLMDRAPGPAVIDGLATGWVQAITTEAPPRHPNGAVRLDHVVVTTPDLARTEAALAAAGFELRRRREAGDRVQSFYRAGEVILELVGPAAPVGEGPAAFWGLVVVVADLDALAARLGDRLGAVKDAVQPGRRIATVRREAGLGLPVACMT